VATGKIKGPDPGGPRTLSSITRVVMFSGGVGSWMTAHRVRNALNHNDKFVLLFADTKTEDDDLYRFLVDAQRDLDTEVTWVTEGRNPWEVFRDVRFIGNSRIDPCSRILKREPLRKWLEKNCNPLNTIVYLGIDWTEINRMKKAEKFWSPWKVEAPMTKPPYLSKKEMLSALESAHIRPPRLYDMGFPHNNCGGFCIKSGNRAFVQLLEKRPKVYAWHEEQEKLTQQHIGKPVTVIRDRVKGTTTPISMREFRLRHEAGAGTQDKLDWGGCACFSPDEYYEEEEGNATKSDKGREVPAGSEGIHEDDRKGTKQR